MFPAHVTPLHDYTCHAMQRPSSACHAYVHDITAHTHITTYMSLLFTLLSLLSSFYHMQNIFAMPHITTLYRIHTNIENVTIQRQATPCAALHIIMMSLQDTYRERFIFIFHYITCHYLCHCLYILHIHAITRCCFTINIAYCHAFSLFLTPFIFFMKYITFHYCFSLRHCHCHAHTSYGITQ